MAPFFMNGVQLPQGYSHFEEAVYLLPFSSQKFLVLILSTSEGWKAEPTLESPSGFDYGTPGLGIQRLNHLAFIMACQKRSLEQRRRMEISCSDWKTYQGNKQAIYPSKSPFSQQQLVLWVSTPLFSLSTLSFILLFLFSLSTTSFILLSLFLLSTSSCILLSLFSLSTSSFILLSLFSQSASSCILLYFSYCFFFGVWQKIKLPLPHDLLA